MNKNPKRGLHKPRIDNGFRGTALALAAMMGASAGPALADEQHQVAAGETLWSIAERYTGSAKQWPLFQKANRLANPHLLRVGQLIHVPDTSANLPKVNALVVFVYGEPTAMVPETVPSAVPATASSAAPRGVPSPLRSGTSVPEGSVITVGDKAFVRLKLADGSVFDLYAGSQAVLERLRRDNNSQQSRTLIRMLSGRVESDVTPRQHPGTRFDIHTPMAVASVRGTRFGVSASPDHATSDVTEGRVAMRSVANPRQTTTLQAGQGARVDTQGGVRSAALLPGADLSALPRQWDDGDFVAIALPPQTQAQAYRLRLIQADPPGGVLREAYVKEPAVLWQALDDGRYTLAVQSQDGLGLLGQTAEHRFAVLTTPAAPLYREPATAATVTGPRTTLRCTEVLEAQAYRIQVASDPAFQQPLVDTTVEQRCEHFAQLSPGHYHWRVASLSPRVSGGQGPFSLPSNFQVTASEAAATPNVGSGTVPGTDSDAHTGAEAAFWSPRAGLSYRVLLAEDPAFTKVLRDEWLTSSQFVLPASPPQTVYLRLQSRDAEGRTSRLSAVHRLTLKAPAPTSGLVSGDGQPVQAGEKPVSGGASNGNDNQVPPRTR